MGIYCGFLFIPSLPFLSIKTKKDTVTGYFNAGASKGQGGDWGRVKGKIRHGKLFIRECSTSGTNDIYACPKYSPEFEFLVKKRKVILRYHNPKYSVLTKEQRKETKDNPFVLYKIYKKIICHQFKKCTVNK